jgi:hypothetical protein
MKGKLTLPKHAVRARHDVTVNGGPSAHEGDKADAVTARLRGPGR